MSNEEPLKTPPAGEQSATPGNDDIEVRISLRLRLDEVAAIEAAALRAKAHRAPTQKELSRLACRIYDARRTREKMLNQELFSEPAWDMLLALYCLPARGEMLTVTGLSYSAVVPQTTGLRWQRILESEDLIERGPKGIDHRKQTLRLTTKGRSLMDAYLTRLFYHDTPTPPFPELAGH